MPEPIVFIVKQGVNPRFIAEQRQVAIPVEQCTQTTITQRYRKIGTLMEKISYICDKTDVCLADCPVKRGKAY